MPFRPTLLACAALSCISAPARADEGMWLPNQTAAIGAQLRAAGLALDPAKLGDLSAAPLNAIVTLGGCSAAFLSDQGLVATNHHCVYGSVQYNSKPGQDYLTDGFLAKSLADEVPAAPGTRIWVIEDLRDVTKAMDKGVTPALSGFDRNERLEANRKRLIATCEKQPNRRCDVRPYYGGAVYYLQQQLEIKDVRLVYAPAGSVGNFGGETDNWVWPRHTGDFGFYRAYVSPDGKSAPFAKANVPYKPRAWLKVATDGVKEGDFVMVAGFPGSTNRLVTAAEVRFSLGQYEPTYQKLLSDYSDLIARETAGDDDARIRYASIIRSADNYKKKTLGEIAGAEAIGLDARKAAAEKPYRDWVAAEPARARYAAAATSLDALVAEANRTSLDDLRLGLLNRAQLLSSARTLYRWAKEREKPDATREPGYQDRDRAPVTDRLVQVERRYLPKVDRAIFEQALGEYRQLPPAARDATFEETLKAIPPDRLYADTTLGDTAVRTGWLDKPAAAFEASTDPFIRLAVALYPGDLAREKARKERAGRMQAARSVHDEGLMAFAKEKGMTLYPDANGSLRFTWGKVTGKTRDALAWAPFTTAEGLLAKYTGRGEFDAPAVLVEKIRAKDYGRWAAPALGTLPVDFMSTVDITNGNSGSSTLNAKGEFVGLAFDGTIEGVVSDWSYDAAINRTIHVDARFMFWVMDKVDHADRLLAEMGVR